VYPRPVGDVTAQAVPGYVTLADASQYPVAVPDARTGYAP
jgi:hypothetical protein